MHIALLSKENKVFVENNAILWYNSYVKYVYKNLRMWCES